MKKSMIAIVLVAGIAGTMVSMAATKQVIRMGETSAAVTEEAATEQSATQQPEGEQSETAPESYKMWGSVMNVSEGGFSFERQFEEGGSEEVIVHIDPEQTLVLGSDGYPVNLDQMKAGNSVYVYAGPAMTLSLPPQVTAVMVIVDNKQDNAMPEYVTAAEALTEDGQGNFRLKTAGGQEFNVLSDCEIIPYLTRQAVRLSDVVEGSHCLIWVGTEGAVEKIVLFNE